MGSLGTDAPERPSVETDAGEKEVWVCVFACVCVYLGGGLLR